MTTYVFSPKGGLGLVPKRGCLLTLAYYAFPRWYAGSNPARSMDVCLLCLYVVLSCVGRGLCDGPITRPKEYFKRQSCSTMDYYYYYYKYTKSKSVPLSAVIVSRFTDYKSFRLTTANAQFYIQYIEPDSYVINKTIPPRSNRVYSTSVTIQVHSLPPVQLLLRHCTTHIPRIRSSRAPSNPPTLMNSELTWANAEADTYNSFTIYS
jgi:hypothetical protein